MSNPKQTTTVNGNAVNVSSNQLISVLYRNGRTNKRPYAVQITDKPEEEWNALLEMWLPLPADQQLSTLHTVVTLLCLERDHKVPTTKYRGYRFTGKGSTLLEWLNWPYRLMTTFGEIPNYTFDELFDRVKGLPKKEARERVDRFLDIWRDFEGWSKAHGEAYLPAAVAWTRYEWRQLEKVLEHYEARLDAELFAELDATDPAGSPLPWTGLQVDLVFITDCLKAAGLLDKAITDAMIVEHFGYGSAAKDKVKTFRQTRAKLRNGEVYESDKIMAFVKSLIGTEGPYLKPERTITIQNTMIADRR